MRTYIYVAISPKPPCGTTERAYLYQAIGLANFVHFLLPLQRATETHSTAMNRTKLTATLLAIATTMLLALGAKAQSQSIVQQLQNRVNGQGTVVINQSQHVSQLLNDRLYQNTQKPGLSGFRIRIFSETGQNARERSSQVMDKFAELYPGMRFYQEYDNPYWKVSVGDFRSRESAQKFYQQVLSDFPKAFLVTDWINFPDLD